MSSEEYYQYGEIYQGPPEVVDLDPEETGKELGFEITPSTEFWTFVPTFYPEDFTQSKKQKLKRYGAGRCGGESVSVETVKNREFHVSGLVLQSEVNLIQALLDYHDKVDLISPLVPYGGMECYIKKGEVGNKQGWEAEREEYLFDYNLDLVSTGNDEHGGDENGIVTEILRDVEESDEETPESIIEGVIDL